MLSRVVSAAFALFFFAVAANQAAADARPFSDFALGVDVEGKIWLLRSKGPEVVLAVREGSEWKEIQKLDTAGTVLSPRIATIPGGLAAAWIEDSESSAGIALAIVDRQNIRSFRLTALRGTFKQFDIAHLASGRLGLFLDERNSGGSGLRWIELALDDLSPKQELSIVAIGEASFLTILPGQEPWLAWQERSGDDLFVAAVQIPYQAGAKTIRFKVRGFGGAAAPVLARHAGGSVMLVWQGKDSAGNAVLRARALEPGKAGPVRILPTPGGISGLLSPRPVAGDITGISAYGWDGERWSAVRYSFGTRGDVSVSIRSDPETSIRSPRLAVDGEGKETWVWAEDHVREGLLRTRSGDSMSREVPSSVVQPSDIDMLKFLCFGDSITAGLVYLPGEKEENYKLTQGYIRKLRETYPAVVELAAFIQEGDPGEKTPEGLVRLADLLKKYISLDFVLILEGTNDIYYGPGPLSPEETAANLGEMVDMIREVGAVPIVGTMLPRFDAPAAHTKEVSAAIYPMARLRGVTICDFQKLFPEDVTLFSDLRLHPNYRGYDIMARLWLGALLTFEGDVDRSLKIDDEDLLRLIASLQMNRGSSAFNPDTDFNDDGYIDVLDLGVVLTRMGKEFIIPKEIPSPDDK